MPIFNKEFLNPHLRDFHLTSVAGIQRKKQIIENWNDSFKSRKLEYYKEEEVKSRFILEIFGEVLGFNYKDAHKWQIREELKSKADATKPDAAIGLFHITETGIANEVHLIIEIKDAKTKLDKPQNRKAFNLSPVSQAFLYASKTDGKCKWVIVSNFVEIRVYHYETQNAYQEYSIDGLQNDESLKEFLYLFSKDRLINSNKSTTDKLYEQKSQIRIEAQSSKHILEQVYQALRKFEGLCFVDPEFLCTIKPFNVLNEHVWHYKDEKLITLNADIAEMLSAIEKSDKGFTFNAAYHGRLKKERVTDANEKLNQIFTILRHCMIREFSAAKNLKALKLKSAGSIGFSLRHFEHVYNGDIVKVETQYKESVVCDCINCRYRKLNFQSFIKSLKRSPIVESSTPLEDAYGEYLIGTEDFKTAYYIYKKADIGLQDDSSKKVMYFVSKINQMRLHNLVEGYSESESTREILNDIKAIDLDRSIHNELDTYVDNDVRKYLIEIKENKLFLKISENIEEIYKQLIETDCRRGDLRQLDLNYRLLYSQFHKNYLVFDIFEKFKTLTSKVVEGFLLGYKAKEPRIKEFPEFYLTETILYINSDKLKKWLESIETLQITRKAAHHLVEQATNMTQYFYKEVMFTTVVDPLIEAQLLGYHFQEKYSHIINNTFRLLSKIDILDFEKESLSKAVYLFLKTEKFLSHFDLEPIGDFILRHGDKFKENYLHDLLQMAVDHDIYGMSKYSSLLTSLCKAYAKYFPNQFLEDKSIVRRAIANATHTNGTADIQHLVSFYAIINDENKALLLTSFEESLETDFQEFLYYDLMHENIICWDYKDYFHRYTSYLNKFKGKGYIGLVDGKPEFKSVGMINLIYKMYHFKIDPKRTEIATIQGKSDFEKWAIDPSEFDVNLFDPEWLLGINQPWILKELVCYPYIREKLNGYLKDKFNAELSKIYFKFFA